MRSRWPIVMLLCVLASLLVPGIASASMASGAETRVWAFDLQDQVRVGGERSLTLDLHPGCEATYDQLASDSLLAARGGRGLGAKAPDQVTPGVRQLEGQYVDDVGQVQPWRAQYDDYGRQVERTDFTDLPDPSTHTNPHHHTREYGPGYGPKGKETRHPGPGPSTGGGQ